MYKISKTLPDLKLERYSGRSLLSSVLVLSLLAGNALACPTGNTVEQQNQRDGIIEKGALSALSALLQDLCVLVAIPHEGSRFLEKESLNYASQQVWYRFNSIFKETPDSLEGRHVRSVIRLASLAHYLLYLGETDEAYDIMTGLQEIEPIYTLGEHEKTPESIAAWLVKNTLLTIHVRQQPQMQEPFITLLFYLMKYPHTTNPSNKMILSGQPEVFGYAQGELSPVIRGQHFQKEPFLINELSSKEAFHHTIVNPLVKQKRRLENKKSIEDVKLDQPALPQSISASQDPSFWERFVRVKWEREVQRVLKRRQEQQDKELPGIIAR